MALPDLNTYQDPEVLTPPDDPDDDNCAWCGDYYCGPDCHPPITGRSHARSIPRRENWDPDS